LGAELKSIGGALFCQTNAKLALIGETEMLDNAVQPIASLMQALSDEGEEGFVPPSLDESPQAAKEGWSTSTAVSFVAETFPTVRLGHPDSPALAVIAKMLRSLYLHREIREKGGAYGGFALYNAEDGLFSFGSYRDPHIVATLDVYRRAADFIRAGEFSDEDIKEAILQVCSEIDKPDPPGPAARKAFYRQVIGLSDETRLRHKERLLKLTRAAVVAAAERYFTPDASHKAVAVISSRDLLEAANEKMTGSKLALQSV